MINMDFKQRCINKIYNQLLQDFYKLKLYIDYVQDPNENIIVFFHRNLDEQLLQFILGVQQQYIHQLIQFLESYKIFNIYQMQFNVVKIQFSIYGYKHIKQFRYKRFQNEHSKKMKRLLLSIINAKEND